MEWLMQWSMTASKIVLIAICAVSASASDTAQPAKDAP
jgi:hypothetical protein